MAVSEEQDFVKQITKMSVDFDKWYTDVVRKAELADYAPIAGTIVLRPLGTATWDAIRRAFDDLIAETGHESCIFPLLIPEDVFMRDAAHGQGVPPEAAWVTRGGNEHLAVPLVDRPASETTTG